MVMKELLKEDLYWIAGLLEGEGCFHWAKSDSPLISLAMTDLDIVTKVRDMMSPDSKISQIERTENRKTLYRFKVYGGSSIEWMKLLYPLMGIRRRGKINEILDLWSNNRQLRSERVICSHNQNDSRHCEVCKKEREFKKLNKDAIEAIAISRRITYREAEKVLSSILSKKEVVQ